MSAGDLHSQFYDAVMKGDVALADHLEGRINAIIEAKKDRTRHIPGCLADRGLVMKDCPAYHNEDDDVFDASIPGWFWWLLALGCVTTTCLLGALIWGIVEVVPALVHWLEKH